MAKPSDDPVWATTGTKVEPSGGRQASGWATGDKLPAQWLNWWMNLVYQWCVYLKNLTGEALTWTAPHSFQAEVTFEDSTTVESSLTILSGGHLVVVAGADLQVDGDANFVAIDVVGGASVGSLDSGAVSGTTGTFSGAVSGTTGTFSGAVSGTTGTFSGNVALTGSNPASTTGFTNTLTPPLIIKAWARVTTTGSGSTTATVKVGANITSVVVSGNNLTLTLATSVSTTSGAPNGGVGAMMETTGLVHPFGLLSAANTVSLNATDLRSGSAPYGLYNFETQPTQTFTVWVLGYQ